MKWSILVAGMVTIFAGFGQAEECVRLSDCPSLLQLFVNRNNIPGMNIHAVLQLIRGKTCGFENHSPKVRCNLEEEEQETTEDDEIVPRTALDLLVANEGCSGSLRLDHYDSGRTDIRTLNLGRRRRYANIRRLDQRQVFNARTDGNCCWRFYARSRFVGRSVSTTLGNSGYPEVQPRSAKKMPCS
jgi:hypothetical protein